MKRRPAIARSVNASVARHLRAWTERKKTPARTTTRLLQLISRQNGVDMKDLTLRQKRIAFGRFPVVGYVWYQDDWGAPRYIPYFHPHQGTDLFAVSGTPVIAVADGQIWKLASGGTGGNGLWLLGDDGVRYYYGHLKSFAKGVKVGLRVRTGRVIGRVGATGLSAAGTYPHVHFEINPGGRGTVNAKPTLDRWLAEAEGRLMDALGVVVRREAAAPLAAAGWSRFLELVTDAPAETPSLWSSAVEPSSTLGYADLALDVTLAEQDWSAVGETFEPGATGERGQSSIFDPLGPLYAAAPQR